MPRASLCGDVRPLSSVSFGCCAPHTGVGVPVDLEWLSVSLSVIRVYGVRVLL